MLSPLRRSRIPGQPARSSSANEGPAQHHDQEAMVVFLQDGHELEDSESAAHIQLADVAVQPAEDAGVVAADEEDLVALRCLGCDSMPE